MNRTNVVLILGFLVAIFVAIGVSAWIAHSSEGQIDVNKKITDADKSGLAQPVNTNTQTSVPNGGLTPQNSAPAENERPPQPTPEAPQDTSSSTDASSTPQNGGDTSTPAQ